MPGSLGNAAPESVLPGSLCRAFARSQEYPVLVTEYRNGESHRSKEAANSRKLWRLAKRLTPAQVQTLRDFYEARNGPLEPFYFYDPYETIPKTGAALPGRYIVRFDCDWNQACTGPRLDVEIALIELA